MAPPGGEDIYGTFHFDDNHKSTENGNETVTQAELDQFAPSTGTYPPPSMQMANFSVNESYEIEIINHSNRDRTITYMAGGPLGLFYSYSVKREGQEIQGCDGSIRCEIPWAVEGRSLYYEMFRFPIKAGETLTLEFTCGLPNIGKTGLYNLLYAQ